MYQYHTYTQQDNRQMIDNMENEIKNHTHTKQKQTQNTKNNAYKQTKTKEMLIFR